MRYRNLHGTSLSLSELGFGTWTITTGWWGTYTDAEGRAIIEAALDRDETRNDRHEKIAALAQNKELDLAQFVEADRLQAIPNRSEFIRAGGESK